MSSTASAPTERRGARAGTRARRTARQPEGLERLRILLAGAMGAILVGYALLVPVAALLLLSGGSGSLDGSFAIAVPMWLAAHQIPVAVEGRALGALPLLPTVVLVAVVALAAAWSVRRLGGRIRHDAGPVVASQAGAAAVVAVLAGALLPGDVSVTTPWASMVGAGLLAGLAAGAGVLRVCGLPPRWRRALPGRPRAALLGARIAAAGLLLSGTVVVLLALTVRAGAVADSFAGLAPDAGAAAGVLLLAVGYLPNALVAGVSWSLGPGVAIGAAEYGPFAVQAGPLPPFPLFAAVPTEPVPGWAALVLVLPIGAGVAAGLVCRRALGADAPLRDRLLTAAAAAGATAVGAGIVAAVAGGALAGGPYDPVSLSPLGVALMALVLLGVPATVAAAGVDELLGRRPPVTRGRTRTAGTRSGTPGPARRGRPGADRTDPAGERDGAGRTEPRRGSATRRGAGRDGDRTGSGRAVLAGERTGSGRAVPTGDRTGAGRAEPAGDRTEPEAPSGDGPGRAARKRDGPTRTAAGRNGSGEDAVRDGATRDRPAGRTRDRPASGTSGAAGARGGSGRDAADRSGPDPAARPRTVGDLVAQREQDGSAAAGEPPDDDGPDDGPDGHAAGH